MPLTVSHPDVACYWHPKKNRGFGPEDFSYGSMTQVWWYCDKSKDHVYQTAIKVRVRGSRTSTSGCPFCAGNKPCRENWLHGYPAVAKELHPTKNGKLTAKTVVAASPKLLFWNCATCQNVWKSSPCARTRNDAGCPRCNWGERLDLRKYPQALKLFDKERNKKIDFKSMHCRAKVWWNCPKGDDHCFKAGFYKSHGPKPECPFCRGKKASSTNNLTLNKRLASEFHPTKNGKLKPSDLTLGSHRKVWWKCPKGDDHEWKQFVYMRKRGNNCPACSNFKLSKTNVLSAYPKIARDFHPSKNGKLKPDKLLATWHKKIFWLCSKCKYEWQMRPYQRVTEGMGCPECYKVNTGRGPLSKRQKAKAARLLEKGLAVAKIADEIGVHFMTIYRIRHAMAAGQVFQ
ncbi:MAG: helix-turn-helix domain-containing protein [Cyanobacteria bacterium SZAS TMP-1]|nr:helix-turn-helix domain-containing protein [Cyanobacteria bacterium SZAS TMP-1]